MIKDTRFIAEQGTVLMLGIEAVVRGSLEAGVIYAAQYPGTMAPSLWDPLHPGGHLFPQRRHRVFA